MQKRRAKPGRKRKDCVERYDSGRIKNGDIGGTPETLKHFNAKAARYRIPSSHDAGCADNVASILAARGIISEDMLRSCNALRSAWEACFGSGHAPARDYSKAGTGKDHATRFVAPTIVDKVIEFDEATRGFDRGRLNTFITLVARPASRDLPHWLMRTDDRIYKVAPYSDSREELVALHPDLATIFGVLERMHGFVPARTRLRVKDERGTSVSQAQNNAMAGEVFAFEKVAL